MFVSKCAHTAKSQNEPKGTILSVSATAGSPHFKRDNCEKHNCQKSKKKAFLKTDIMAWEICTLNLTGKKIQPRRLWEQDKELGKRHICKNFVTFNWHHFFVCLISLWSSFSYFLRFQSIIMSLWRVKLSHKSHWSFLTHFPASASNYSQRSYRSSGSIAHIYLVQRAFR